MERELGRRSVEIDKQRGGWRWDAEGIILNRRRLGVTQSIVATTSRGSPADCSEGRMIPRIP